MIENMNISPETLYYIATQIKGEHIDYVYFSLMDDISKNHNLYEQKCIEELEMNGFISENMWGDVCIDDKVKQFLHPVFWGKNEASIEIQYPREQSNNSKWFFHNDGIDTIQVSYNSEKLHLQKFDANSIGAYICWLMPEGYNDMEKPKIDKIQLDNISRIITVISYSMPDRLKKFVYFEIEGLLCEIDSKSNCIVLSPQQFYAKMNALLSWKREG